MHKWRGFATLEKLRGVELLTIMILITHFKRIIVTVNTVATTPPAYD